MEFKDFTAGKDDQDRRLDRVLRIFLKEKGLPEIYKLLRKGLIKLNHKKASPETHVMAGDIISIAAFLFVKENDDSFIKNQLNKNAALKIVFENDDLLIIDKDYDRSVHGKSDGIYKDVLEYLSAEKSNLEASLSFKPGPLHRLDRRTTGLLVFSKSLKGAHWFTEAIKKHIVQKKYFGLAEGKLLQKEIWTDYIRDSGENAQGFYTVKAENSNQKQDDSLRCETIANPIAYGNVGDKFFTLIEYEIKTGRKHQIRSQSALHKHPLAGDTAYDGHSLRDIGNPSREFYLQAYFLTFPKENPLGLPSQIKINLSSDFIEQLQCCGIKKLGL